MSNVKCNIINTIQYSSISNILNVGINVYISKMEFRVENNCKKVFFASLLTVDERTLNMTDYNNGLYKCDNDKQVLVSDVEKHLSRITNKTIKLKEEETNNEN